MDKPATRGSASSQHHDERDQEHGHAPHGTGTADSPTHDDGRSDAEQAEREQKKQLDEGTESPG